jgi:hypothetical protein
MTKPDSPQAGFVHNGEIGVGDPIEKAGMPKMGTYRPWSKGRVWTAFFLGMHAAGCMTFFFHPLFAFFGFAFGLPAVILTSIEIREFPEARRSGAVKWSRITGLIGLIGGPIALFLFGLIIAAIS